MLKSITEYLVTGIVIFVGISVAIGLLILIVSTLKDFFFNTEKRRSKMKRICLDFATQEEADAAVMALSRGYQVTQHYGCVSSGLPYHVNFIAKDSSIYEVPEKEAVIRNDDRE